MCFSLPFCFSLITQRGTARWNVLYKTTDMVTKSPVVTKSGGAKAVMSLITDMTNLKNHIRSLMSKLVCWEVHLKLLLPNHCPLGSYKLYKAIEKLRHWEVNFSMRTSMAKNWQVLFVSEALLELLISTLTQSSIQSHFLIYCLRHPLWWNCSGFLCRRKSPPQRWDSEGSSVTKQWWYIQLLNPFHLSCNTLVSISTTNLVSKYLTLGQIKPIKEKIKK